MKPGYCENREEYNISKKILFLYLHSKQTLEICAQQREVQKDIIDFVQKYIVVYEQSFLFYPRMYKRCFHTCTNSCHEGTNFGAKEHSSAIKPTQNMKTSAESLNIQGYLKAAETDVIAYSKYTKKKS